MLRHFCLNDTFLLLKFEFLRKSYISGSTDFIYISKVTKTVYESCFFNKLSKQIC